MSVLVGQMTLRRFLVDKVAPAYAVASIATDIGGTVGSIIHLRDSGMPRYAQWAKKDPTHLMQTPVAATGKVVGCGLIGLLAGPPILLYFGGKELQGRHR
jgi:O-antigen/teichoic acid export membrane protein